MSSNNDSDTSDWENDVTSADEDDMKSRKRNQSDGSMSDESGSVTPTTPLRGVQLNTFSSPLLPDFVITSKYRRKKKVDLTIISATPTSNFNLSPTNSMKLSPQQSISETESIIPALESKL